MADDWEDGGSATAVSYDFEAVLNSLLHSLFFCINSVLNYILFVSYRLRSAVEEDLAEENSGIPVLTKAKKLPGEKVSVAAALAVRTTANRRMGLTVEVAKMLLVAAKALAVVAVEIAIHLIALHVVLEAAAEVADFPKAAVAVALERKMMIAANKMAQVLVKEALAVKRVDLVVVVVGSQEVVVVGVVGSQEVVMVRMVEAEVVVLEGVGVVVAVVVEELVASAMRRAILQESALRVAVEGVPATNVGKKDTLLVSVQKQTRLIQVSLATLIYQIQSNK